MAGESAAVETDGLVVKVPLNVLVSGFMQCVQNRFIRIEPGIVIGVGEQVQLFVPVIAALVIRQGTQRYPCTKAEGLFTAGIKQHL